MKNREQDFLKIAVLVCDPECECCVDNMVAMKHIVAQREKALAGIKKIVDEFDEDFIHDKSEKLTIKCHTYDKSEYFCHYINIIARELLEELKDD